MDLADIFQEHNCSLKKLQTMILHYLKTAWRNLLKNRTISMINILGLTLGLASAVIAIAYAQNELSYEKCHENAPRIAAIYLNGNFGDVRSLPTSFGPEGEALQNLFPEIEARTISRSYSTTVRAGENLFIEDEIVFADSMFFKIFSIPFIEGSLDPDPQSIVISEKAAARYFGDHSPVGKSLRINCNGTQVDFTVTGIFRDLPTNTHVRAEFFIPFSFAPRFGFWKYQEYNSTAYNSYVLLKPGTDLQSLNEKIRKSYKIPVQIENISAYLLPLKEIHFRGTFENTKGKLMVFLIGGLFVLLISCLNFINLTTILFAARARETGIHKVNGAKYIHMIVQLLTDTMLSTLISFNLAIVLLKIALPWFNARMYTHIQVTTSKEFLLAGFLLFVAITILSGLYPAIRYASVKPLQLMKPDSAVPQSRAYSRWILTTLQLILSIVFVQVIMVMDRQNLYLESKDISRFNGENVICITGYPWGDLNKVKDELEKDPTVEAVSWGSTIPKMGYNLTMDWREENNTTMATDYYFAPDYTDVYQIKMLSGRFFSDQYPSDKESAVVINEKTAFELGYSDPLNKQMLLRGRYYTIIGVVDDYMAVPPILDKMPAIITCSDSLNQHLLIRINPLNREATHQFILTTLKKFNPDYPVDIKYHDDILMDTKEGKSYVSASRLMHTFFLFTIINSLFGIFGLSVFIAQRYKKQIGIRKTFGAGIAAIMLKLSKGLLTQTFIAIAFASPLSYILSKGFLTVFPTHFEPGIWFFLLGGIFMLILLLATVSWQTWKAAMDDPINSLRYE
jgi:putative ABC transport system permease protein